MVNTPAKTKRATRNDTPLAVPVKAVVAGFPPVGPFPVASALVEVVAVPPFVAAPPFVVVVVEGEVPLDVGLVPVAEVLDAPGLEATQSEIVELELTIFPVFWLVVWSGKLQAVAPWFLFFW